MVVELKKNFNKTKANILSENKCFFKLHLLLKQRIFLEKQIVNVLFYYYFKLLIFCRNQHNLIS